MTDIDTIALNSGATHKDTKVRNRYYRYSTRMQQCDKCDGDRVNPWNWKFYCRKLPGGAIPLRDNEPLEDDEFQSWHDDPGYF